MTTPNDDAAVPRPEAAEQGVRRELSSGARAMLPLTVGYLPFGVLLGAAIARSTQRWAAWAGTDLIYGGSAQLTLVEMLRSGAGLWAAVGAALLINARLLVYSSALIPLWGTARGVDRILAAAAIIDPTWMVAIRRAEQGGTVSERRAHFTGAAVLLAICWTGSVTAGVFVGGSPAISDQLAVAGPICLVAIVAPHLRITGGFAAIVGAAAVTVATAALPAGSGVLLAMAAAAALGGIASRATS